MPNPKDTKRHCAVCGKKITSQNSSKNRNRGTYTGLCASCRAKSKKYSPLERRRQSLKHVVVKPTTA